MLLVLLVILTTLSAQAELASEVVQQISREQIRAEIEKPSKEGIPVEFFQATEPRSNERLQPRSCDTLKNPAAGISPSPSPSASPSPTLSTEFDYELLLVAEGGNIPKMESDDLKPAQYMRFESRAATTQRFNTTRPSSSPSLTFDYVKQWAQNASADYYSVEPSEINLTGHLRNYFIESIVQTAASVPQMSENQMAQQIGSLIQNFGSSEEERFELLTLLSSRLYQNYNDARSPGFNIPQNNPNGIPLPDGDLTLQQIFGAAAVNNNFAGGVCNDIAEAIAYVGQSLFPDRDVLTASGSSHFGVIIADGKTTRVIDGSKQMIQTNNIEILPGATLSNVRINQVKDGKMREIGVLDTQYGQLLKSAYGTSQPLLKTGGNVSDVLAHYTRTKTKPNGVQKSMGVTTGMGILNHSNVYIVVAKVERNAKKDSSYFGLGGSMGFNHDLTQSAGGSGSTQGHVRMGWDHQWIHYKNPRLNLTLKSGVHGDGMLGTGRDPFSNVNVDFSGGVNTGNVAALDYKGRKPSSPQVSTQAEVWHSVGPKNWGLTTGALSTINSESLWKVMKGMNLHLNQVYVHSQLTVPLSEKKSNITQVEYQGSNIGQRVDLKTGFEMQTSDGAEIYVFVGASTSALSGYRTQYSLLTGPKGGQFGGAYLGKKGLQIEGAVNNLIPGEDPQFRVRGSYPLVRKKKTKPVSK